MLSKPIFLTGVDIIIIIITDTLFAEGSPPLYSFQIKVSSYYLFTITCAITTHHLLILCAVRVSNKLKSWNENQMSHAVVQPAAAGRQQAPPPPHQLRSPTGAPRARTQAKFSLERGNMWAHALERNNTRGTLSEGDSIAMVMPLSARSTRNNLLPCTWLNTESAKWTATLEFHVKTLCCIETFPPFYIIMPYDSLLFEQATHMSSKTSTKQTCYAPNGNSHFQPSH